jgi:hypothetical protein
MRFPVAIFVASGVFLSTASAADVLSSQQVAKLALDWLLFDDHGVQPAGVTPAERPIGEAAAYLRARLSAQRQIYFVFADSDDVHISARYDIASRSLEQLAPIALTGTPSFIIRRRSDGSWKVRFRVGDGFSGPVVAITQHSGGSYVRYAGFRIVCP